MDKNVWATGCGVIVLVAVLWLVGFGGHIKVKAQLDAAADSADGAPVTLGSPLNTGICPGKHQVHIPSFHHQGKHPMYHHPQDASPNMTAQMSQYWRFCPPSEGDL